MIAWSQGNLTVLDTATGARTAAALTQLYPAYPNPFNPSTTVSIDLTHSTNVAAVIFDAKGRLIKKLWGGPLDAGVHRFEWNGRNEAGQQVASGVYLAMVTTGRDTRTLKLTFIK